MKLNKYIPNSKVDEMFTYNKILDHIEKDKDDIENDTEQLCKFQSITAHQGPLCLSNKDYKGSQFNVIGESDTGRQHKNLMI
jgi:hypothetical protein